MASFYLTINDAVRAKIEELVESKGLDAKDYPYSSDAAISLNQLSAILGGSGNSQSIADSIGEVLKNVGESGGGGSSSGPVLEWTQLVGPEDVFTYDSEHDNLAITIDDKFGWTETSDLIADAEKWMFAKCTHNGETKYSYKRSLMEEWDGFYNVEWLTTLSPDTSFSAVGLVAYETSSVIDTLDVYIRGLPSDVTSGVSIYVAEVTDWNE